MDHSNIHKNLPLAPEDVKIQISDIIVNAGFHNDRGAYDLLSELLAPEVTVDAVSLFGGEIETLPKEELIARYKSRLPGCDYNQHMISCLEVRLDGAEGAVARSYFRATHRVDQKLWVVGGLYTHRLIRSANSWRIACIAIELGYEEGDRGILDIAAERVASRAGQAPG